MATSRGLKKFAARMDEVSSQILGTMDVTMRKLALVTDQVAVLATPVDTGRARGNWIVTLGEQAAASDNQRTKDKSGNLALEQARGALGVSLIGGGGRNQKSGRFQSAVKTIFLTNSVEYVTFLDQGSSRQAPAGMTQQAITAGLQALNKFVIYPDKP